MYFGIQYSPQLNNYILKNSSLGIVIDNLIKPALKLYREKEYLPREYRIVAEKKIILENTVITLIGNYTRFEQKIYANKNKVHFGCEYAYKSILLWGGFKGNKYTFGCGLKIYSFLLSYGYGKSELQSNNVFSVSWIF